MKEVQNIGKRMPYAESEDYLNRLISQATEQAISQGQKAKTRPLRTWIAAAAAALVLIAGLTITYFHQNNEEELVAEQTTGPIDQFLDSLTDDEAQQLAYYEIEDIQEYY